MGFNVFRAVASIALIFSIAAIAIAINAQLYTIELKKIVAIMNDVLKNQINEKTAGLDTSGNQEREVSALGIGLLDDRSSADAPPLDQAFPGNDEAGDSGISVKLDEIFALPPVIMLEAKNGNAAVGKASMAIYNGMTFHKLAAINLPPLNLGYYYAAWLKNPDTDEYHFTGQLEYEASSSSASLFHEATYDLSTYATVIISRESQTAEAPRPLGETVLEGNFPADSDLHISDEDILNFRQSANMNEDMERGLNPGQTGGAVDDGMYKNLPIKQLTDSGNLNLGDFLVNKEAGKISVEALIEQYLNGENSVEGLDSLSGLTEALKQDSLTR